MSDEHQYTDAESAYFKWLWQWRRRTAIAQGLYEPATVLKGGRVLNVFSGELIEADVAVDAGVIAGVGQFPDARDVIDVRGMIVTPSFIDPHLHLESTLLWPPELARAVVPHGTGAIIADPHEIANVAGLPGVESLRAATQGLPLDIRYTAPSCVPASPLESPGASFELHDIEAMLAWPDTLALGELMNFPGVLAADPEIGARIWVSNGQPRDGHAPGLRGPKLQAYAGAGMHSDHESFELGEAREKLRAGLVIMMRQGSSEKNLLDLLPLVDDETWPRITFCSDDRDCHDLTEHGHVDDILRTAIRAGLDPVRAIQMATWNPARHWRMDGIGAVAPGYRANLVALTDLESVSVEHTFHNGRLVASGGELLASLPPTTIPDFLRHSANVAPIQLSHMRLTSEAARQAVELIPGQIVTRLIEVEPVVKDSQIVSSVEADLLKLVCVERHHATGRVGVGLVRGFGFKRGAMASTIAHDAHNIIAVGTNDADILAAIATVAESQGGLAVVSNLEVLAHLGLPLAGLVSDAPLVEVSAGYVAVEAAARDLGSSLQSPFGQLAFLALSVIPEARVTDRGLVDLRM
ncbi:MAG: adenine deaminase [Chloroflexota bacterium]|nr:adenine deaminase [Chloroflexota bacterium]